VQCLSVRIKGTETEDAKEGTLSIMEKRGGGLFEGSVV
jgi:hypothetical protein